MLQDIKQFYGRKIGARDGAIGHVKDFYFDDRTWAVRYLVADTGSWLPGRQVLLTPHVFGCFDTNTDVLRINLTRTQIEESPSIDSHLPVSRQYEEDYYRYYGWPVYWQDGGITGASGFPPVALPPLPISQPHHGHKQRDDVHLRSMKSVTNYAIQATDGPIGSVRSFMVHGTSWDIRKVIVETGHWYAGKPILILPESINRISYEDSTVFVNLTKNDIEKTLKNNVAHAGAGHR